MDVRFGTWNVRSLYMAHKTVRRNAYKILIRKPEW